MTRKASPAGRPATSAPPASPCVGLCVLDAASGLCAGCARTGAEIAAWRDGPEALRVAVWAEIPARAARLGLAAWMLPWGAEAILDHLARTLAAGGACALGFGAAGTFRGGAGEILRDGDTLVALGPGTRLRLTIGPAVRAFGAAGAVVLGLPGARSLPAAPGPDSAALRPADRGTPRFDLRLGAAGTRLGLRAADPEAAGGTWVVETALGRVETPGTLARSGAALPDLPATYVAGAEIRP